MTDDIERRLTEVDARLDRLEATVDRLAARLEGTPPSPFTGRPAEPTTERGRAPVGSSALPRALPEATVLAELVTTGRELPHGQSRRAPRRAPQINWEQIIGARGIGWAAVVVLLFATAFFVKYSFDNGWIGPLGRVAVGVVGGVSLVVAGAHYHARSWRVFAQMLTAGGVSLLYLTTYSAYGFYHLLPTPAASAFLAVLVVESAWLALRYDALAIALMAIIGGLLTPVLMHSERDQFRQLFIYLLLLNVGVVALRTLRPWPALGTIAFLGAEAIYALWSSDNYHPEKRPWALGFQIALGGLYVADAWRQARRRADWINREDPIRLLLVAILCFGNCYWLVNGDHHEWTGAMALAVALLFAVMTRHLLAATGRAQRISGTAFALSAGFVAMALPLQARGPWNALGWAVEAGALAWFGLRVERPFYRALALPLALLSFLWLLTDYRAPDFTAHDFTVINTSAHGPPDFSLASLFNSYTLTALSAVGSMLAAIACSRRRIEQVDIREKSVFGAFFVALLLLAGYFVSGDLVDAVAWSEHDSLAQMILSGWWSLYAALLLAVGFYARVTLIRWTALAVFGATIFKVFYYDMAGLADLYRVGAFFLLAMLLGMAAWAYQRFMPADDPPETAKG